MNMRCKLRLGAIEVIKDNDGNTVQETLAFSAVGGDKVQNGYPGDGLDEDNTFARWSPSAEFCLTVANLALFGKFKQGEKFYVDFTKAS